MAEPRRGASFLDLVEVQDRLRSVGGCPWDREQTHESLVRYLVEEAYECVEAIETGDRAHLREELGDLLMQIVFHARIAEEHETDPWTVDDVAADITAKLVRRHPHVFADGGARTEVTSAADVEANWDEIKAAEKNRASVVDGVPLAQPALALADALLRRAERAGVPSDVLPPADIADIGARLLVLVAEARSAGVDPEAALREAARAYRERVSAWERAQPQR